MEKIGLTIILYTNKNRKTTEQPFVFCQNSTASNSDKMPPKISGIKFQIKQKR